MDAENEKHNRFSEVPTLREPTGAENRYSEVPTLHEPSALGPDEKSERPTSYVKPTTAPIDEAAAEKQDDVTAIPQAPKSKFSIDNSASPSDKPSSLNNDNEPEPVVSLKVWIVAVILSCGYGLSFWSIPVIAAIGGQVSASFDEPTGYVWYIPAWTVSITCGFMIFGPNTDLLGRRWFLVIGNLATTVGHIVVASAKSSNQVIAGLAISGFGGSCCQMAAFALPELLPNKWRHIGVVIADLGVYAAVIVAPVTARYGWEHGNWEWNFWGCAIFQFLSFAGLAAFYFPPARPNGLPLNEVIRQIDYLGIVLFLAGAVPVLVGIV